MTLLAKYINEPVDNKINIGVNNNILFIYYTWTIQQLLEFKY